MAEYVVDADVLGAQEINPVAPQAALGGVDVLVQPVTVLRDFRQNTQGVGSITDRVMYKADASSPEQPFRNGRVWLLRLVDGWRAWEGYSDADGYYTAEGLELGVEYIAVGIDPYRGHKATGAGPVTAT